MPKFPILLAWLLLIINTVLAQQARSPKTPPTMSTITQGICGTVVVKRGNHMPSPDAPPSANNGSPVERDVLIFPLLNMSQVDMGDNGFINSVRDAKPIKTTRSDKAGKFCVELPVGRYSVMVKESNGLYANLSDRQGNIFPVNVEKNHPVTVGITISHQARF